MKLAEYCNKYGRVMTLLKIGHDELSAKLEAAEAYKKQVVKDEGIKPFDERPKDTQRKLNAANKISFEADNMIWNNRKCDV